MPTLAPKSYKQVKSWSFSRWTEYMTCPQKFAFKNLDKLPEPGSPAMERGSAIHKLAEQYTKGELKKLPKELELFKEEFADLKKQKQLIVEDSWTFTANWEGETAWNDWNNAWLRVKLDVMYMNTEHLAIVPIDHKTGKPRDQNKPEYLMQLELYALCGLVKYPDAKVASPRLWYLDAGVIYPDGVMEPEAEYTQKDVPALKKIWLKRIAPMMKDTTFKPKQNWSCNYCHFRKANGGPCVY